MKILSIDFDKEISMTPRNQLYVDMDGVLADFDKHYGNVFGIRPSKADDNVDWKAVRKSENFYYNIPPMEDFDELWSYISQFNPIILTGVPASVPEAPENKKSWIRRHIGNHQPVICTKSRTKSHFCRPGDILIDDWEKYRHLWIEKGGKWITHTTAKNTIHTLEDMGY